MRRVTALIFLLTALGATFQPARAALDESEPRLDHTRREETLGATLWQKLEAKEIACADLSDEEFGFLGEYFMGQMLGDAHEAMNEMMVSMMGEEGEEAMHVVLGRRLSGCDRDAAYPAGSGGWMPMMQMLAPFLGQRGSWMNFGYGFGFFGWIWMIFWWALIILGIVYLVRWIARSGRAGGGERSALDILKERYARGEIGKKEFEERKRDLL